jgi:hypothetical protein
MSSKIFDSRVGGSGYSTGSGTRLISWALLLLASRSSLVVLIYVVLSPWITSYFHTFLDK